MKGLDISSYQNGINFDTIKNAGKYEIVAQIKRKILDLLEKGAEE